MREDTGEEKKQRISHALGFDPNQDAAPRILAGGEGEFAEKINSIARSFNIPVIKDPELAEGLRDLPLGPELPENLHRTLAAIFSMAYTIRGEFPGEQNTR